MALTPMMTQYMSIKEGCKDCILFFRLGDFYEMFFEDAVIASRELELVLTGRDCGLEERAPMCGIPYHAANNYISRLISKGYKVAICEQVEDPSKSKGIVKRDIIRIVTPGTYTDTSFLEEGKNNFLMCIYFNKNTGEVSISSSDISTGEFYCTLGNLTHTQILDEISKFKPSEILLRKDGAEDLIENIRERFSATLTFYDEDYLEEALELDIKQKIENLKENIKDTLKSSINVLLKYINHTQKTLLSNITSIEYYQIVDYLIIDNNSRTNLELTESMKERNKKGSLLWVLDKTSTSMGARRLRKWVEQPLLNKEVVLKRQNAVEALINNVFAHEDLKEALSGIYDIERLVGKISSKNVNAKELIGLKNSICKLPSIKNILSEFESNVLKDLCNRLDTLNDIYMLLDSSIKEDAPNTLKDGNIIKDGYDDDIDTLRYARSHGKEWIANLEKEEKNITGIKSLKVGYNKVFGYYIEVTKSNLNLVPEDRYIRKQTLSNGERYITPELKEMEAKVLGAEEKLTSLEYNLFINIRDSIEKEIERMKATATIISELDCLNSLATVAKENNYVKPIINEDGIIDIKEGRHPVVEITLTGNSFVENDTCLDNEENRLLLITGPNMAGKSTFMRQVALITLMAQLGSFVPAKHANISICDRIFTRIGASDDLASGKSTFMVEMWEVANILKNATKNSLVILDEVGRGTSTHDGLSIAWAVIEHISKEDTLKCKTLFATHYHELIKLEKEIPGVKNYSIAVKKIDNEVVFLRKIIKGGTDESYGIEVAKLAGLPNDVIERAKEILITLKEDSISDTKKDESTILKDSTNCPTIKNHNNIIKETHIKKTNENDIVQISFEDIEKSEFFNEICDIDILNLTPMDGFNKLFEIIQKAKNLKES
ncbi:DNA mismatch repair protein MutS [Hathewaya histolytica]|uniref:DNA mismatch repair protein MutS n=1 Tax=Hathewaya histolytica TaxID=1498 RepID=A0A4U9RKG2_HATHI|nr:DNA mismatch repair protein MutS [Hathewaya histolytica]VTQ89330.1 DNA mismatch repair protein MutS [Hathewaya histolytica]